MNNYIVRISNVFDYIYHSEIQAKSYKEARKIFKEKYIGCWFVDNFKVSKD